MVRKTMKRSDGNRSGNSDFAVIVPSRRVVFVASVFLLPRLLPAVNLTDNFGEVRIVVRVEIVQDSFHDIKPIEYIFARYLPWVASCVPQMLDCHESLTEIREFRAGTFQFVDARMQ